jgi:hypothetical protein
MTEQKNSLLFWWKDNVAHVYIRSPFLYSASMNTILMGVVWIFSSTITDGIIFRHVIKCFLTLLSSSIPISPNNSANRFPTPWMEAKLDQTHQTMFWAEAMDGTASLVLGDMSILQGCTKSADQLFYGDNMDKVKIQLVQLC